MDGRIDINFNLFLKIDINFDINFQEYHLLIAFVINFGRPLSLCSAFTTAQMMVHQDILDKMCHVAFVQPYTTSSDPRAASDVSDLQNVAPSGGDASGHSMTGPTSRGIRVAEESRGALERAKERRNDLRAHDLRESYRLPNPRYLLRTGCASGKTCNVSYIDKNIRGIHL
jgi:hypothetical protein